MGLDALKSHPHLHPLVVQLLGNRGINGIENIEEFIRPDERAEPAHDLADMGSAVQRILTARDLGERVAIHGDYDADGVTASVILYEELRRIGIDPIVQIPLRQQGYGLTEATVNDLARQEASLIITIDCGVTAHAEVELAIENGIDVIITDHHQIRDGLPPAYAVIHPARTDQSYRYENLAGSGVAMTLVSALREATGGPSTWDDPSVMELVALGTVADIVRLTGENRSLVTRGLRAIRQTSRVGLIALCEAANVAPDAVTSHTIGYVLAPRLNAAGRLSDARISFELLSTSDPSKSRQLALELDQLNRQRQQMMEQATDAGLEQIGQAGTIPSVLTVFGSEYEPGIAGLVAGKLVEEYYRPAVVIAVDGDIGRASARSINGFDIARAIAECGDIFIAHGGHPMAAGFSIKSEQIEEFVSRFQQVADSKLGSAAPEENLDAEAQILLDRFELDTFDQIARLEPFGNGNPVPILVTQDLEVRSVKRVGRDGRKHLRLNFHDGRRPWTAMWFGHGDSADEIPPSVDIMFTFQPNTWNGLTELQLNVIDLQSAGYLNTN